jgi:hypothetical protein
VTLHKGEIMKSIVERRGVVEFPENTGERIYMFPIEGRLPSRYARWQRTVDQMLDGIDAPGPVYLMVDQGIVNAGQSQRRPGLHVDGNWVDPVRCHGHQPTPPSHHHPAPTPTPRHIHAARWDHPAPQWKQGAYRPEAIVLASDVTGCIAYEGQFDAAIDAQGACAADVSTLRAVELLAGIAWVGNVTMLHEATPMQKRTPRTIVRLNVPGWEPA